MDSEVSASAAVSSSQAVNFSPAKMLPRIGDYVFVVQALHSLAFLPTVDWLCLDAPLQDLEGSH